MPELVAIGAIGAALVFILVNINLFLVHRSFQSEKIKNLNHNLSLVRKYWSQEQGRLIKISENQTTEELIKKDHQKATRSAFLFGTLMIFMSWIGLIFFVVYYVSVNHLAVSRFEKSLMASDLTKQQDMKVQEVLSLLGSLQQSV